MKVYDVAHSHEDNCMWWKTYLTLCANTNRLRLMAHVFPVSYVWNGQYITDNCLCEIVCAHMHMVPFLELWVITDHFANNSFCITVCTLSHSFYFPFVRDGLLIAHVYFLDTRFSFLVCATSSLNTVCPHHAQLCVCGGGA